MKRDMDLCRLILLEKEADQDLGNLKGYDESVVLYHLLLLKDAGLIEAEALEGVGGMPFVVAFKRLTWSGHEFLDAARNDTVWKNAKGTFVKKGLSATFDTMKAVLVMEIKQHLGLP